MVAVLISAMRAATQPEAYLALFNPRSIKSVNLEPAGVTSLLLHT